MALQPVPKEAKQVMMAKRGLNEHRMKEAVKVLQNWLKQQPHLPSECGK